VRPFGLALRPLRTARQDISKLTTILHLWPSLSFPHPSLVVVSYTSLSTFPVQHCAMRSKTASSHPRGANLISRSIQQRLSRVARCHVPMPWLPGRGAYGCRDFPSRLGGYPHVLQGGCDPRFEVLDVMRRGVWVMRDWWQG
jgi:hypothetical protein